MRIHSRVVRGAWEAGPVSRRADVLPALSWGVRRSGPGLLRRGGRAQDWPAGRVVLLSPARDARVAGDHECASRLFWARRGAEAAAVRVRPGGCPAQAAAA